MFGLAVRAGVSKCCFCFCLFAFCVRERARGSTGRERVCATESVDKWSENNVMKARSSHNATRRCCCCCASPAMAKTKHTPTHTHTHAHTGAGMCANLNKESNEEQQRRVARRVISQAAKSQRRRRRLCCLVLLFCHRWRCCFLFLFSLGLQRVGGATVTAGYALSIRTRS